MNVLRMRSDRVTQHINIFISVTWSSWVCRDSAGHHSLSYRRTSRMMLLYISALSLGGILRIQTTLVTSRVCQARILDIMVVAPDSKVPELFRLPVGSEPIWIVLESGLPQAIYSLSIIYILKSWFSSVPFQRFTYT